MRNFLKTLFICIIILIAVFTLARLTPLLAQATPVLSVAGTGSNTYPGYEATYRLELLNHTDQIVYDGVLSATLPIGFSYVPDSTIALGEGWPMESREPIINGQTLTWGPYHLPAAGIQVHNPFGIHTMMDSCDGIPALHLEGAKTLVGNGGYVTQLFYPIDTATAGPSQCAVNFVNEAYARNLIPVLRLQGHRLNGIWQAPNAGPDGNYTQIAQAYARYVAGLPRRDTNPLYIVVWNEPDLWIEWNGQPNATQYARFFVAVSKAIRQIGDARIRVVNGALTPGNTTFLTQMLQVPGFRDAFEVWASHCYPYNHPAWYNIHSNTAQYGTYAIDCYLQETAIIKAYGRTDFKVMLTETGYALGNNTFGFEGFPAIDETNRAGYIANAFKDYWQQWPEIVAVTPFELTDPTGHWATFDWVNPVWPYPPHAQYDAVTALPKPQGELHPYGYQINFKAAVRTGTLTGTYTLQLSGSERNGHTAFVAEAAPITVRSPAHQQIIYLPLILKSPGNEGPWYFSINQAAPAAGNIAPTHTFTSTRKLTPQAAGVSISLSGQPQAMIPPDNISQLTAVLLTNGDLDIINLDTPQTHKTVFVGNAPQMITPGPPEHVYISLADGLALVNLQSRSIVNRRHHSGLLRGLAWDSATQTLFAVDARHNKLLAFKADLSQQTASLPLPHQPNQLILNSQTRQLYISFPAIPLVAAVDINTLTITAQASLTGGPILNMALDNHHKRLYVLNALAPHHHGLTVFGEPALTRTALVAGSGDLSLQTGMALTITPGGQILISESGEIRQITADDFTITQIYPTDSTAGDIKTDNYGNIYMLDSQANALRIYQ